MTGARHESIKDCHAHVETETGPLTLTVEDADATVQVRNPPTDTAQPTIVIEGHGDDSFHVQASVSQDDADSLAWDLAGGEGR